ncbi:MAG: hypothetical protein L3K23_10850 [Thermoplasmata archaeon]|nr:hypothetical protein [Thermoplasmata archaeon]
MMGRQGGQVYVDQMFNLAGAAVTSLTQMNANTSAAVGLYTPLSKGHLISIQIQVSPQAATSLAQSGYITLTSTAWAPINTQTIPFTGFGLATAPQPAYGNGESYAWENVNLPVDPALGIKGSVIYFFSPVTPNITVTGRFSTF